MRAPPRSAADKTASKAPHFAALDAIRGIAALCVVLFHVPWSAPINVPFVRNSYLMVDFFFVLSGFVVFYAYSHKLSTGAQAARFVWLRFWRLYPLHFFFLMTFLLFEFVKARMQVHGGDAFAVNNAAAFWGNLFLVQGMHLFPDITFNTPAWSISVEFFGYLAFLMVMMAVRDPKRMIATAAAISAAGFIILCLLGPDAERSTVTHGFVRCVTGFFLGIAVFAGYDKLRQRPMVSSIVEWLAIACIAVTAIFLAVKKPGYSDLAIYPGAAAIILFVALSPGKHAIRALQTKPMVWLGTVSYSIYMAHSAVLWCVNLALRAMFKLKAVKIPLHDMPVWQTTPLVGTIALAFSIAAVLLLSHFTYYWIEKPFRDWSRKSWRPNAKSPSREDILRVWQGR